MVQVVLQWLDPIRRVVVQRVVSRKIGVVPRLADYLRTVNPLAAASLLAKRWALDAKRNDAHK